MTILDPAPPRNGADVADGTELAPAAMPDPAPTAGAPSTAAGQTPAQGDPPQLVAARPESPEEGARRHALWFFWMWLLFATVVSIGGNVIHAWMTAPEAHLKLLAAAAAAVPPAVLLGSTHSAASTGWWCRSRWC